MKENINLNCNVDNGIVTLTSITFSNDTLAKRYAHFIHTMLETDNTLLVTKDDDGIVVEQLINDDNDFYSFNPWLDDDEEIRWEVTLKP